MYRQVNVTANQLNLLLIALAQTGIDIRCTDILLDVDLDCVLSAKVKTGGYDVRHYSFYWRGGGVTGQWVNCTREPEEE